MTKEPDHEETPNEQTRPILRIETLHIKNYRAIRTLKLPEDGLGWKGNMPDVMLIGGINGSGKTTLLELVFGIFAKFPYPRLPKEKQSHFQMGFTFRLPDLIQETGGKYQVTKKDVQALSIEALGSKHIGFEGVDLSSPKNLNDLALYFHPSKNPPRLIYIPSNERSFTLPPTSMKKAGKLTDEQPFAYRWDRPKQWEDSLEALLYSARWEDLNAKEEGRPDDADNFAQYNEAFGRFFEGKKTLVWHGGELFVEIATTGERHGLEELSSGEKQLLILVSELFRRWKPGSLVLIDEPELHLHSSWQTRLYQLICELQQERGGQVIITTQSNHLFQLGEPGTKLLLGGKSLT